MNVMRFCEIFTEASIFPMETKKMCTDPHRPNLNPARPCPYKYLNISTFFIFSFFFNSSIYPSSQLILVLIFSIHTSSQKKKVK